LPLLRLRTKARPHEYEIRIGRNILSEVGQITRASIGEHGKRAALVSNKAVFEHYGPTVTKSLRASGFTVLDCLIGDGESSKSLQTAENTLHFLSKNAVDRTDVIVALGGGVVGDLAGFVAAVYLRGVSFVQVPTTLLSQIDSSVGGKTAVNLPAGKNLVGSFHQPAAVVIDVETLTTLPARELVAGWCECVKQGAVSGRKLFNQTNQFLDQFNREGIVSSKLEQLIASHCRFKASIVASDERESLTRRDHRSRRVLNFGHTIAHALEAVTNYKRFRHGEAVGHGMLVAGELSRNLGLLEQSELELLKQAVTLCGPLPLAGALNRNAIIDAIAQDKKRAAGQVQWVLLEKIGRPRIVDGKEISKALLRKSISAALR